MLHNEEKLTWSGLTVKLRNSTHERGYKIKLLHSLKQYHSLNAQCERENIHLILITALCTCKQIFPSRLSVKNMNHFATVFRCFDCEYKCK